MDKILLIDAHNAIWRACVKFGATPTKPKVDENGDPIPEVEVDDSIIFAFNFFRNLRPLIEEFSPVKCFFVLEGHPQFRYDLFSDYKANRIVKTAANPKSNERFFKAKNIITSLIHHLPITACRAANYEADDVIATLCENMKDEDLTVISNDSDYIQLLQRGYKNIQIFNPIKKTFMESPSYPYVAWKCLNGDKSDNIPSLLKPKKALDTINDPELFKKFLEVDENKTNFNVNRQLIEFRSVPEDDIILAEGARDFDKLKVGFTELKFESIVNDKSWDKYVRTFDCIKY